MQHIGDEDVNIALLIVVQRVEIRCVREAILLFAHLLVVDRYLASKRKLLKVQFFFAVYHFGFTAGVI